MHPAPHSPERARRRRTAAAFRLAACAAALVAGSLLGAACASSQLAGSWRSPAAPAAAYSTVMILAVQSQEDARRRIEDAFATVVRLHNVRAIASHLILPEQEELDRARLESALSSYNADAVLVIRAAPVPQSAQSVGATAALFAFYGRAWQNPEAVGTGGRGLEVRLFDARSADAVWWGQTRALDLADFRHDLRDVAEDAVDGLTEDGLVPAITN